MLRTKTLANESTSGTISGTSHVVNRPDVTNISPRTMVYRSKSDIRTDEPHPRYAERLRNGELLIGHYSRNIVERTSGGGSMRWTNPNPNPGDGQTTYSELVGNGSTTLWAISEYVLATPNPAEPLDKGQDAKLKAIADIQKSPYGMMEDLLTLRESVNMLRDPLEGLKSAHAAAKRGHRNAAGADLWSYYRFGATPFVRSISDILEGMVKPCRGLTNGIRMRSVGKSVSVEKLSQNSTGSYGDVLNRNVVITRTFRAEIFYRLRQPVMGNAWKFGIRAQDLPAGIWAAVPYSFMVDRVYNVSRICQALTNLADPNVVIEGGCFTTRREYNASMQWIGRPTPTNGAWPTSGAGDLVVDYQKSIFRTPWVPSLGDARATLDVGNLVRDATYVADLAALTLQRVKH